MAQPKPTELETDPRFPSGKWTGYFLQPPLPGRQQMELLLTFQSGKMTGEGRDRVGRFTIDGMYQTSDGRCAWSKRYIGKHDVVYEGFNEGKGIWGKWRIPPDWHGGFHIWPEGVSDSSQPELKEALEPPVEMDTVETGDEVLVGAGAVDE